jgi:xylulose-5-phosphate/fructose-6-phosphate phosphoketolase
VPIAQLEQPGHLALLEQWLRSYRPEELFDESGRLLPQLRRLAPEGARRMGAQPSANGGALLAELVLPEPARFAVPVAAPGALRAEATRVQGQYLREVMRANPHNFRVFSPDETTSNRWDAVLEVTSRCLLAETQAGDERVAPDGRVMEMLSEHQCQGWLEGYLLTGRHGMFSCYEAFIHIVGSMFNQHAKWLNAASATAWRRPIASLNYLLSSHVWRQDHNGASHQDPGFIDHVLNKKAAIVRVYLPPDANTLLAVTEHCLRSRNLVNVIVAGKQPAEQWLDMRAASEHCRRGIGLWRWASSAGDGEADAVLACAGDVPTLEALAAAQLLNEHFPALRLRLVNVVDLMTLQPPHAHPHGLPDAEFDALFTPDKPVVFAYHGYPSLIHRLTYRRTNHDNIHVHGFREEGTTTTPFDMVVLNQIDRFRLYLAVVERVPALEAQRERARSFVADQLVRHRRYIEAYGVDLPEVVGWRWRGPGALPERAPCC